MKKENNRLKFYADTPAGDRNKLFVFSVQNITHAIDLAAKFVQEKKFIIRAAYYENPKKTSVRIDKLFDLKTEKNSIEESKKLEQTKATIKSYLDE